jgi:hypothetical protein
VLGENAGGMVTNLIKAKCGSIELARAALEQAATKANPREYIGAINRAITANGNGTHMPPCLSGRDDAQYIRPTTDKKHDSRAVWVDGRGNEYDAQGKIVYRSPYI